MSIRRVDNSVDGKADLAAQTRRRHPPGLFLGLEDAQDTALRRDRRDYGMRFRLSRLNIMTDRPLGPPLRT